VKLLLDTHIVLWAAGQPDKLSPEAAALLTAPANSLFFSAANLWEVVIKGGLGRTDFQVDPARLRKMLIQHGYTELPITAEHVLRVQSLPLLHRDPFDRILLAQARVEGMRLVTVDLLLVQYGEGVVPV
jgi:PIN domain nuclease of toxin-antitoxin system